MSWSQAKWHKWHRENPGKSYWMTHVRRISIRHDRQMRELFFDVIRRTRTGPGYYSGFDSINIPASEVITPAKYSYAEAIEMNL